jgi:hypothetical protein
VRTRRAPLSVAIASLRSLFSAGGTLARALTHAPGASWVCPLRVTYPDGRVRWDYRACLWRLPACSLCAQVYTGAAGCWMLAGGQRSRWAARAEEHREARVAMSYPYPPPQPGQPGQPTVPPSQPSYVPPSYAPPPYGTPYLGAPPTIPLAPVPVPAPGQWRRARSFWSSQSAGSRVALLGAGAAVMAMLLIAVVVGGFAILRHVLPTTPDGYLTTDATDVVFVQWQEDQSHHLSGSWQQIQENTADQTVSSTDVGITGVIDGSHITITFTELGTNYTLLGTLSGDNSTLTLQVPDQNGYIGTAVFHAASVADYNNAAAQLRQGAAAQAAATQSAQATAATQAASAQATASAQSSLDGAVTNANEQLSSAFNTLNADVQSLAGDSDFSNALNAYAKDWAQMQTDYAKEQSDYANGCGVNGYNATVVAYDASVVSYDLGVIQYDDGTLNYDQTGMNNALASVQSDMTAVQSDWQTLQSAVAADTTGSVAAQFSASDVNGAVGKAQSQVTASNKALSAAQGSAAQYDQEAAQTNTDAQNLANSMHC